MQNDKHFGSQNNLDFQINFQTSRLDLSTIYGVDEKALQKVRLYEHGLLNLERRGERYVPQNITNNATEFISNLTQTAPAPSGVVAVVQPILLNLTRNDVCLQNEPNETICYLFGKYHVSLQLQRTKIVKKK